MKHHGFQLDLILFIAKLWRRIGRLKTIWVWSVLLPIFSLLILSYQNCSGGFKTLEFGSESSSSHTLRESKAIEVLANNCNSCHGTSQLGGVSNITNIQNLVSAGLIVPGEPEKSKLFQAVSSNKMPPSYPLSSADKTILSDWILSLGNKAPGGSVVPSDLSFPMTLSTEPQLFRLRLAKIQAVLGNTNSSSVSRLVENRFLLGDYDFSKGITPKYSFEVSDMQTWLQSIEPVCQSFEIASRFAWPAGAGPFVQLALARDLNAADNVVIQQIQNQTATNAEKLEIFCLTVLSSLEFIAK